MGKEKKAFLLSSKFCPQWIVCPCPGLYIWLSRLMTKPTKWHVRPAKTLISLGIRTVWSESSLCGQWVAKDPSFLHTDSEVSDLTGWMPRPIWVFTGLPSHVQGLEMITCIIYNPDLRLAFCWYLIIWKTLSLKYFPKFPPVKIQLTSMDKGQLVINSCQAFQKVMHLRLLGLFFIS